ncbi:MAG: M64 family metallopeptidase [Bacteroidia bacterium]|nr:M64 family metallopeptidase [Bacteroidia bacterium]
MNRFLAFAAVTAVSLSALCSCNHRHREKESAKEGDGTVSSTFTGSVDYDTYFTPERMRIDFVLAGDADDQYAFLSEIHRECEWAGSPNSLIDKFGYGQYFFEAFSSEGQLIYSKGFSTLFEEWRTTPQAKTTPMAANQTVWMPFPKDSVHIVLYQRIRSTGLFTQFFECDIDPADTHIIPGPDNDFNVKAMQINGDAAHKVDLVFAGEAYTRADLPKLRKDAERMMEYLFSFEPYKHRRDDFNVYLVESISEDGGVDIPNWGQWRRTAMDSSFDTFYEDRYLTIMNHSKIASVYSGVPFDALFIIANESKYGGGGIYGSYAMGTSDNEQSDIVFIHEFGHSFAGLGDEYYTSAVAYEDCYPAGVEPWEPNITTLVNFEAKWADMIEKGTPVPTPNDPDKYYGTVGVFEGAGYMAKGCYRPYFECRMINNTAPGFCPVCQRAIEAMIDYYVK